MSLVFVMITTLVCAVGCKKAEAHKHTWATEWSVGGETHWHACTVEGCTAKKDEGNHEGGTANCTDKKVCTVCGNAYGEVDSSVHKSNEFVYVSNGDGTHTKKYKCCNALPQNPKIVRAERRPCAEKKASAKSAMPSTAKNSLTTGIPNGRLPKRNIGISVSERVAKQRKTKPTTPSELRLRVRQRRFAPLETPSTAKKTPTTTI